MLNRKSNGIGYGTVIAAASCAVVLGMVATGCATSSKNAPPHSGKIQPAQIVSTNDLATNSVTGTGTNANKNFLLQEGDTIKIDFAGAPTLDSIQVIRRDGNITLSAIGEYNAAGKTPTQMADDLRKLYDAQLVNKEVTVTVQSSAFVIYVMGSVQKPGKLVSERPLNMLEALIEAGIDPLKSNLKSVQVIRTEVSGATEKTTINMQKFLKDKHGQMPDFKLRSYDVINVPEKFNWF